MDNINKEANFRKAQNTVLRLLKYRLYSESELRDKLKAKKHLAPIIEQTIQYCKECGLIDDRVFARHWTASRLKKPFGLRRIQRELKEKGIDAAVINGVLNEAEQNYDEAAVAGALAKRRAAFYNNVGPEKIKLRVYGYLLRRGFKTDTAMKAIKNI